RRPRRAHQAPGVEGGRGVDTAGEPLALLTPPIGFGQAEGTGPDHVGHAHTRVPDAPNAVVEAGGVELGQGDAHAVDPGLVPEGDVLLERPPHRRDGAHRDPRVHRLTVCRQDTAGPARTRSATAAASTSMRLRKPGTIRRSAMRPTTGTRTV